MTVGSQPSTLNNPKFLPLIDHLLHISMSLLSVHVVLFAEGCSETVDRKIAHFTGLFPYPCCCLVETDELAKVNGTQAFANYHMFATDCA